MKKLALAALLLTSTWSVQAGGSASASMEMSFVIRAACSVQTAALAAPQVACTGGTVHQVLPPAAHSSATLAGATWQVVF